MRLAFVLPSLGISGGIKVALDYADGLHRLGHSVDVINLSGIEYDGWAGNYQVPMYTVHEDSPLDAIGLTDYDFAVATFWPTVHFIAAGRVKARFLSHLIQGDEINFYPPDDSFNREAVHQALSENGLKIVVSRWLKEKLSLSYPDQEFLLIPNGVDVKRFADASEFMERGNRLRVLVEGPIGVPLKRVMDSLALMKQIEGVETWLVSSTDGELGSLAPDLTLIKVPYKNMPSIYKSCDILLKLSKTEGFSLPPLEMMASGGIPIVNDFGGQRDFLKTGVNGIVLENISDSELYEALEFIRIRAASMQESARATARAHCWHDQPKRLEAALLDHTRTHSPRTHRPRFDISIHGGRKPRGTGWVYQGAQSSPVLNTSRIRGWIALRSPFRDVHSAELSIGGRSYTIELNEERPDVAAAFNGEGIFGFNIEILRPRINSAISISYRSSANGPLIHKRLTNLSEGRTIAGRLVFHIDRGSTEASASVELNTPDQPREIFVEFSEPTIYSLNGVESRSSVIYEKEGRLLFQNEKLVRTIERY